MENIFVSEIERHHLFLHLEVFPSCGCVYYFTVEKIILWKGTSWINVTELIGNWYNDR